MAPLLRVVLATASVLAGVACRAQTPLPMPDALRSDGLVLVAAPPSLAIQPQSSGNIRFQLSDEQDQPVADYPVSFVILDDSADGGTVGARLSTDRGLTDQGGQVVLQALAGDVGNFVIQAQSPGAPATTVDVIVTPNRYEVAVMPAVADDLIRAATVARARLYFFDGTTCSSIDLSSLRTGSALARGPYEVAPGDSWDFFGVSGQGSAAVAGLGLDSSNVVRIAGCLDLPGSALLEGETISATLLLDRLMPSPVGTYTVASDIALPVPPSPPASIIEAPWQEWTRCPSDPARLWLDCTIDALATSTSDPLDCVPSSGAEGALGTLLESRRGVILQGGGSATSPPLAPCRDQVDATGKTSLDALVSGLFDASRSTLGGLNLGGLATELASLLTTFHLTSTMRVRADQQPNAYLVDHDLVDIGFPGQIASSPALGVSTLGLPVPGAHGVPATMIPGSQLKLAGHGFTLRLGTALSYTFEATSLQKSRSVAGIAQLVTDVFSLAKLTDPKGTLNACEALDATCCDQIKQPRGCLLSACNAGMSALAQKLLAAFAVLDGSGLDFYLSLGYAQVIDANGDGHADALGALHGASGVAAPGLWVGNLTPAPNSYPISGTWIASGGQ